MNPKDVFCPNIDCLARGKQNRGNIGGHSQKEQRYVCQVCKQTFRPTKGSILYRLHTDREAAAPLFPATPYT